MTNDQMHAGRYLRRQYMRRRPLWLALALHNDFLVGSAAVFAVFLVVLLTV